MFTGIEFDEDPEDDIPITQLIRELPNMNMEMDEFVNLEAEMPTEETYGPHGNKTCLRGFRQKEIQTSHLSYRD